MLSMSQVITQTLEPAILSALNDKQTVNVWEFMNEVFVQSRRSLAIPFFPLLYPIDLHLC